MGTLNSAKAKGALFSAGESKTLENICNMGCRGESEPPVIRVLFVDEQEVLMGCRAAVSLP
jgi:hypothetical protein